MRYNEIKCDLFSLGPEYYLAHCISADFALGAGIAVQFNRRFDLHKKLKAEYPRYANYWNGGTCLLEDRVFNLVTKSRYWQKPTYKSMSDALVAMRDICVEQDINRIAMPMIGCGLDKLDWHRVSKLIKETFVNTEVEIIVCRL